MIYDLATHRADEADLRALLEDGKAAFLELPLLQKMLANALTLDDYQGALFRIFHQVYSSSGTFSLAAARCPARHGVAREYLMHHAEEEKTHWTWILNDLDGTGYAGPDPRKVLPPAETLAYVAFNHYIATHQPIARLGIAAMLETLGASFGKRAATSLLGQLGLTPAQCSFFFGHGDTDIGHTEEIFEVLQKSDLTPEDWGWICRSAETASKLYGAMISP